MYLVSYKRDDEINTEVVSVFDTNNERGFNKLSISRQLDAPGIFIDFQTWELGKNRNPENIFTLDANINYDLYGSFIYLSSNAIDDEGKNIELKNDSYPQDRKILLIDKFNEGKLQLKFDCNHYLDVNGIYMAPNGINNVTSEVVDNFFSILKSSADENYDLNNDMFFDAMCEELDNTYKIKTRTGNKVKKLRSLN